MRELSDPLLRDFGIVASLVPHTGPTPDVMAAWDDACLAAFNLGVDPVVMFPRGRFDGCIRALIDQYTGREIPVTWLPPELFPTDYPGQYFNPDLIHRAETSDA